MAGTIGTNAGNPEKGGRDEVEDKKEMILQPLLTGWLQPACSF
jgi:hypothetical protein